ncbi:MAG: hypothetical protein H8F28_10200 [Fibrella sp.]|nr:hypothetical protein [Armatimonadota bacterium]
MATPTIEERLTLLEEKVARFVSDETASAPPRVAWWKKIVGVYKNDPEFAEAERLGREYRESLRPKTDDGC